MTQALMLRRDERIRTNTIILHQVLKNHVLNQYRESYTIQSTITDQTLKELTQTPQLVQAVVNLNMSNWVKELESTNNDFKRTFENRFEPNIENINSVDTLKACDEIYDVLQGTFKYIDAMFMVSTNNNYQKLAQHINEIIDEFKTTLKRCQSKLEEVDETSLI